MKRIASRLLCMLLLLSLLLFLTAWQAENAA